MSVGETRACERRRLAIGAPSSGLGVPRLQTIHLGNHARTGVIGSAASGKPGESVSGAQITDALLAAGARRRRRPRRRSLLQKRLFSGSG